MATKISYDFDFIDLDDVDTSKPTQVIDDRAELESIPHLVKKISGIWGTGEIDVFLNKLVMDSRDGQRQGLPVAIAEELMFLAGVNKMHRAIDFAKTNSIKLSTALKTVDEGDQARLRSDIFDDPGVTRDTVIRQKKSAASRQNHAAAAPAKSQFSSAVELAVMLATSKWLIGAIILILALKVVWPLAKGFF